MNTIRFKIGIVALSLIILGSGYYVLNQQRSHADSLLGKADFLYVLQGYDQPSLVSAIVNTPSTVLVVDPYTLSDKEQSVAFTNSEVADFKTNHSTTLAYVSIGEAEDYRAYWKDDWVTIPPDWMGKLNADWPGNFKVKYWDPNWQQIVFSSLDKAVDQGFDGAYLDIVDGYEYWSDSSNGENEQLTVDDAAQRMIQFLAAIRSHTRLKNPNFKIFPQNAPELVRFSGYLDSIDGIGKESTWYTGFDESIAGAVASARPASEYTDQLALLKTIQDAGKTVVSIDYIGSNQLALAQDYVQKAHQAGFLAYASDHRLLGSISSFIDLTRQAETTNQEVATTTASPSSNTTSSTATTDQSSNTQTTPASSQVSTSTGSEVGELPATASNTTTKSVTNASKTTTTAKSKALTKASDTASSQPSDTQTAANTGISNPTEEVGSDELLSVSNPNQTPPKKSSPLFWLFLSAGGLAIFTTTFMWWHAKRLPASPTIDIPL